MPEPSSIALLASLALSVTFNWRRAYPQHFIFGYRRVAALLRGEGFRASATRVYRLWRREGLKVPQKKRKRRRLGKSANGCHRRRAEFKDHVWAWDFVFDKTTGGAALKWLSIVDEHTRESLALKTARSITSEDVAESFNSRFRDEFLAIEEFESLAAARQLITAWQEDYNHYRPHGSLGYQTPAEFAARCTAGAEKSLEA